MPPRYIWAPSEIPPKCKLQRLEKERCVAEAEKFIAEFYRQKFIKPAPKNYQFNHIVDFRADFSGSYLRFCASGKRFSEARGTTADGAANVCFVQSTG